MVGKHDENSQSVGMGISLTDNITPITLRVDPATNMLLATARGEVISPTTATKSRIDQNEVSTVYGVSDTDGKTLIPIRTDSDGYLLVTF